jgi:hypothetical protein
VVDDIEQWLKPRGATLLTPREDAEAAPSLAE